jgi:hypothetical protein
MLSIFSATPTLLSTLKLGYVCGWDLLHFLQRLPRLFLAEVIFLLTGIESDLLPFSVTPYVEI